ncbi:MAG: J domain-containing protein [Bacteroidota bacterium]
MLKDHLDRLGIKEDFDPENLKKAFRKKALEHHPDRNRKIGNEQFIKLKQSYEYLCNQLNNNRRIDAFNSEIDCVACPEKTFEEYLSEKEKEQEQNLEAAKRRFEKFVSKNSYYRLKWYYNPFKVCLKSAILLLQLLGVLLIMSPLSGFVFGYNRVLIITIVPLLIFGAFLLNYSSKIKILMSPFFAPPEAQGHMSS